MKKLLQFLPLLVLPVAFILMSYSSGSPGGRSGSPGDSGNNCTQCHSSTAIDASDWITSDIPSGGYELSEVYTITASGTHSGVSKFGFELTAEDGLGNKVGTFSIINAGETQIATGDASVTHTSTGTTPTGDSKTWAMQWTAPNDAVGDITFYAAFNGANGNGASSGDQIYLSTTIVSEAGSGSGASDLFFSEYAEGSSFNKYVEISNATGGEVDLSIYQIKKGTNGADFTESMFLTGTLADGDVWVVSRSDADPIIVALADELNSVVINFNGDDVMGLFKNDVLIDIIGMVGDDPGDGWPVAGVEDGTKDHTLVRKPNVCDPTTDWISAAGTNADDSQWVIYEKNDWDNLGFHVSDCGGGENVATPTFTPSGGTYENPVDVEIACATLDATIYYTLDGSDPDESSTPYATAINISEATTLKARAYASDLDPSNIAQANYSFIEFIEVANLSELRDLFPGGSEVFTVTGEVFLSYQQDFRGQKYIQDAGAGILIDDYDGAITSSYQIGDGISGLTGSMSEYGGMLQFIPSMDPGAATSTGNQITPVEITVSEMLANFEDYESRLVKIQNATFVDQDSTFANGSVYEITDNSKASGNFRTTFYDVDYIGTVIPEGAGVIIGLLNSRTDGEYITARNQADFIFGAVGEPSNYPMSFVANASEQTITLTWTDATGEVLPEMYLIKADNVNAIALPVDGTPEANDTNLADGMAAMNIEYGVETYTFIGLQESTTYYFSIFPYTNTGDLINYKADLSAPVSTATTEEDLFETRLFTTFNESWEAWEQISVVGDQVWDRDNNYGIDDTPCAKMSGFSGSSFANEDWLISPQIDVANPTILERLIFNSAKAYTGMPLQVKISVDYDGDPTTATWDDLTDQAVWPEDGSFFVWTNSGIIDISNWGNDKINIAFVYQSTDVESATWEVDNIYVKAQTYESVSELAKNNINIYPNPGNGIFNIESSNTIKAIEVFSLTGALVAEQNPGTSITKIDLSDLNQGIYFARISDSEGNIITNKIVIK